MSGHGLHGVVLPGPPSFLLPLPPPPLSSSSLGPPGGDDDGCEGCDTGFSISKTISALFHSTGVPRAHRGSCLPLHWETQAHRPHGDRASTSLPPWHTWAGWACRGTWLQGWAAVLLYVPHPSSSPSYPRAPAAWRLLASRCHRLGTFGVVRYVAPSTLVRWHDPVVAAH
jgi:hypothetical protein